MTSFKYGWSSPRITQEELADQVMRAALGTKNPEGIHGGRVNA